MAGWIFTAAFGICRSYVSFEHLRLPQQLTKLFHWTQGNKSMWYIVQNILGDNVRSERHQHKRPLYISHYTTTCAIDTLRNHATMRSLTNWCSPQQEAIQLYDSLQKASRVSCLSFVSSLTFDGFRWCPLWENLSTRKVCHPQVLICSMSFMGRIRWEYLWLCCKCFRNWPLPVDGVCVTEFGRLFFFLVPAVVSSQEGLHADITVFNVGA